MSESDPEFEAIPQSNGWLVIRSTDIDDQWLAGYGSAIRENER